jgi:hypothetical protein
LASLPRREVPATDRENDFQTRILGLVSLSKHSI